MTLAAVDMPYQSMDALFCQSTNMGVELTQEELETIKCHALLKTFRKSDYVLNQVTYSDKVFIVLEGTLASEFCEKEDEGIFRFFAAGEMFANLDNNLLSVHTGDSLVALSSGQVCIVGFNQFMQFYMAANNIGVFFRRLVLNTMLVDKKVMCLKTLGSLRAKQQYFEQEFGTLMPQVGNKDIASFFGVSPQSYSRFLKFYKK